MGRACRIGLVFPGKFKTEKADTGAGFDATHVREGRFGMAQVIERVASSTGGCGVVHVQSAPGAGTTVALELPIDQASA